MKISIIEIKHKFIHYKSCKFTNLIRILLMSSNATYLPVSIYLFKVNKRNTINMFIVNNKDTRRASIDIFLVSLLLTLNIFHFLFFCWCCYFEQVNGHWHNK